MQVLIKGRDSWVGGLKGGSEGEGDRCTAHLVAWVGQSGGGLGVLHLPRLHAALTLSQYHHETLGKKQETELAAAVAERIEAEKAFTIKTKEVLKATTQRIAAETEATSAAKRLKTAHEQAAKKAGIACKVHRTTNLPAYHQYVIARACVRACVRDCVCTRTRASVCNCWRRRQKRPKRPWTRR